MPETLVDRTTVWGDTAEPMVLTFQLGWLTPTPTQFVVRARNVERPSKVVTWTVAATGDTRLTRSRPNSSTPWTYKLTLPAPGSGHWIIGIAYVLAAAPPTRPTAYTSPFFESTGPQARVDATAAPWHVYRYLKAPTAVVGL